MPHRIDSAFRFIDAPPAAVYAEFADPKAMEQWVPPGDMAATMLHFDFRKGGRYRMRLTYREPLGAGGKTSDDSDEVEVRFIELIEFRRIEQAVTFESSDAAFAGVMRMTWTFDSLRNGTLVPVRAEDVPRGIRPEDHEAAMKSTLDKLASFLGAGAGT